MEEKCSRKFFGNEIDVVFKVQQWVKVDPQEFDCRYVRIKVDIWYLIHKEGVRGTPYVIVVDVNLRGIVTYSYRIGEQKELRFTGMEGQLVGSEELDNFLEF